MKKKGRKKPWLAILLSFLLPGLGQLYNGQFKKALSIFALIIFINVLSQKPIQAFYEMTENSMLEDIPSGTLILVAGYSLASIVVIGVSIYDASATAKKINLNLDMENKERT